MSTPLRVLILHRDPCAAEQIASALIHAGFQTEWERVSDRGAYLDRLVSPWVKPCVDVVLSDVHLTKMDGLTALRLLRTTSLDIPFIFVTETQGEDFAIECFRQGASDYLRMDRLERLGKVVAAALERKRRRSPEFVREREIQHLLQSANVLIWSATVEALGKRFRWTYHLNEEQATGEFNSIELLPGRTAVESWKAALFPTERKRAQETARRALRQAAPGYEQEFSCVDLRGSVHYFREKIRIEPIEAGKWRLFGVWTDVTEVKRAQEGGLNLREQIETLLVHAMSTAHCLLWQATIRRWKSGLFVWNVLPINEDAAQQFFPLEVFPNTTYFDSRWTAMDPDDRERIWHSGQDIPKDGKQYSQEFRCRSLQGEWRWFRDDVVLKPAGKDRWWAVGVCTDITDIKQEQEKIRELNERLEERVQERTVQLEEANRDLRRMAIQSRELSRQLVGIQELERRSLARELHDEVGQWLTGLKLSVEAVERRSDDNARAALTEARRSIQELITRIQSISQSLRPPMLDLLGIVPTLRGHVERYERQTGIQVAFSYPDPPRRYSSEIELTLFRFVQEALNNIVRHARTHRAMVKLTDRAEDVAVSVVDWGIGFDVEAVLSEGARFGLLGMRERIGLVGGELEIRSSPGTGTRLTARIPLPPVRKHKAGATLAVGNLQ